MIFAAADFPRARDRGAGKRVKAGACSATLVPMSTDPDRIYKILSSVEWAAALRHGAFEGSAVDRADGFVHLSAADQVEETAEKHFAGQTDLKLLAVSASTLGGRLRWEPSRGGRLFPHLYGPLPVEAVVEVFDLPLAADGRHVFPQL